MEGSYITGHVDRQWKREQHMPRPGSGNVLGVFKESKGAQCGQGGVNEEDRRGTNK